MSYLMNNYVECSFCMYRQNLKILDRGRKILIRLPMYKVPTCYEYILKEINLYSKTSQIRIEINHYIQGK